MNLSKTKILASKVLKVGRHRIKFDNGRIAEIKEVITKQDIKDLYNDKFIIIKPLKGRKKVKKRKTRRGPGKIKKSVKKRKQTYVKITRKLRKYIKELREQERINRELYRELRKKIRMRAFKSKANLKEYLEMIEKIDFNLKLKTKKKEKPKKQTKPETGASNNAKIKLNKEKKK